MNKVYVMLAEGFEEIEALTVVDILRRAGLTCEMVSISDEDMVKGSHGIVVKADLPMTGTDLLSADMIVLPGGLKGTMNLKACGDLADVLRMAVKREDIRLAAICAAPTVFGHHGLLHGVRATCYPGMEEELTGAIKVTNREVVTDGRITTSRGMGTAIPFALSLAAMLAGEEKAAAIEKGIVYRTTEG